MGFLVDIHDDAAGAVKAAINAAYEAGRSDGRKEALAELQTHMASFFNGAPAANGALAVALEPVELRSEARAAPGSVKPMVERMLTEAHNGLTPLEIAERAGFKYNSVRGTLWALGKEGFAISQGGRWFAIANKPDGVVVTTVEQAIDDEEEAMNAAIEQNAARGGHPELR